MSADEKIIEKITKLLAKANGGGTEEEALSFMDKAKELMNRYNVSENDLSREDEQEIGIMTNNDYLNSEWRKLIWQSVGRLFFCEYVAVKRYNKTDKSDRFREATVHLYAGRKANVIMATNMANYLVTTIIRLAQNAAKENNEGQAYIRSFIDSCALRVINRLDERYENEMQTDYLRIVHENHDKENTAFLNDNLNFKRNEIILHGGHNAQGSDDGHEAGEDINFDMQVEKDKTAKIG